MTKERVSKSCRFLIFTTLVVMFLFVLFVVVVLAVATVAAVTAVAQRKPLHFVFTSLLFPDLVVSPVPNQKYLHPFSQVAIKLGP